MSKSVDRLSEARERIKLELKVLAERRAELGDKVDGLKSYIDHLERLLNKARQASSNATLEEVIRLGELKVQTKPTLFKLSKYLVEKKVGEKLELAGGELKEILEEIQSIERRKKDANVCPECQGRGQKRETRYVRDDGMVRQVLNVKRCFLCEGKGRIE